MKKEMEEIIWRRKVYFCGREEKGGKYLEKENIVLVKERKNRERKGGKYLEEETILLRRRRKTEKEKEENIWRMEIFFLQRRRRMEKETKEKCKRSSWTQNVSHRACSHT